MQFVHVLEGLPAQEAVFRPHMETPGHLGAERGGRRCSGPGPPCGPRGTRRGCHRICVCRQVPQSKRRRRAACLFPPSRDSRSPDPKHLWGEPWGAPLPPPGAQGTRAVSPGHPRQPPGGACPPSRVCGSPSRRLSARGRACTPPPEPGLGRWEAGTG